MATICSDEHWHQLWEAANRRGEFVDVLRDALADVLQCAKESDQVVSDDLIRGQIRRGQKRAEVDRVALFNFLHEHSHICAAKERAAKKAAG